MLHLHYSDLIVSNVISSTKEVCEGNICDNITLQGHQKIKTFRGSGRVKEYQFVFFQTSKLSLRLPAVTEFTPTIARDKPAAITRVRWQATG